MNFRGVTVEKAIIDIDNLPIKIIIRAITDEAKSYFPNLDRPELEDYAQKVTELTYLFLNTRSPFKTF